ncbi:RNA polymerase sigma factor [bacterium]|nr:RNA polymerase sigma factor [bacterium]
MAKRIANKFKEDNLNSRARKQDQDAFIKLYNLYVDDIYRFIYFKVGQKEEAQDITSSVFMKAWDYITSTKIKEEKNLKALFYKIARNSVVDYYRQNKNQISLEVETEKGRIVVDESVDVDSEVSSKIEWERVSVLLNNLKPEYKEVILLRHVNELSWEEISQITGKKMGAMRVLLHRASKALEKENDKDLDKKNKVDKKV